MDESTTTILMGVFNGLITNVNSKLQNGDTIFDAIRTTTEEANLTPADKKTLQILLNQSFKDEIFGSALKMVNDNKRNGIEQSDAVENVLSYLTENNYLMGENDNLRNDFLLYLSNLGDLQSEVNMFDAHLHNLTQGIQKDPPNISPITIPSDFSPDNNIEKLPLEKRPIYQFLIDKGFLTTDTFQKQTDMKFTDVESLFLDVPGNSHLKMKVLQDTGLI